MFPHVFIINYTTVLQNHDKKSAPATSYARTLFILTILLSSFQKSLQYFRYLPAYIRWRPRPRHTVSALLSPAAGYMQADYADDRADGWHPYNNQPTLLPDNGTVQISDCSRPVRDSPSPIGTPRSTAAIPRYLQTGRGCHGSGILCLLTVKAWQRLYLPLPG